VIGKRTLLWATFALLPLTASASDLSYTFLDFSRPKTSVRESGVQTPVAGQTVRINTHGGNGIAMGGSVAIGRRFYLGGSYKSSLVDVTGVVSNPLVTVNVADTFDLVVTTLAFGYIKPIGEELDLIAEVSYDSTNYDFGSFAGENFDSDDSGAGARVGLRWNPAVPVELYGFARYSPVAKALLSQRTYETGTSASIGVRWYFFENLGVGLEHENGDVDTTTISMRFSFGNLQW
jgi:hypothetical protein